MIPIDPSLEELQKSFELVHGELYRKEKRDTRGNLRPRRKVECRKNHSRGYCVVSFGRKVILYHRIIYILTYGSIPGGMQIDHINGNRIDNRIENLRLVTNRQNGQNKQHHRNGRLVGCTYNKRKKRWNARVRFKGIKLSLGNYKTEQEAHQAYITFIENNL